MKLKKLIALGLATVMSASMLVGCGAKSDSNASTDNGDKVFKVGMITDTGGVNDDNAPSEPNKPEFNGGVNDTMLKKNLEKIN